MNFFVVFGILTMFASSSNGFGDTDPDGTETSTVSEDLINEIFETNSNDAESQTVSQDLIDALFATDSPPVKDKEGTPGRDNPQDENIIKDLSIISALNHGYEHIERLLIQGETDINEVSIGGTALHAAVVHGDEKLARLLIHNGADLNIKNIQGKSPSDVATEFGFTKLARVLQENVAQKACEIYSNVQAIVSRVYGGETVKLRTEFPWMAALGYVELSTVKIKFSCGGTLISEKFVLTAAHCARKHDRPVLVRLGELHLNNTEGAITTALYLIENIIRHPKYSSKNKINDIALIELADTVYFSQFIRPACLQTHLNDENPNVDLTVAGWGIVSPKFRNRSNALLKANINTMPWSKCNSTMSNHARGFIFWVPFQNGIHQCHYCAAHPNAQSDTCEGDSGGPLQIVHPDLNMTTIVGVVSAGVSCGNALPGIYTRVAYFIDWIESYVWPNGEIAKPLLNEADPFF